MKKFLACLSLLFFCAFASAMNNEENNIILRKIYLFSILQSNSYLRWEKGFFQETYFRDWVFPTLFMLAESGDTNNAPDLCFVKPSERARKLLSDTKYGVMKLEPLRYSNRAMHLMKERGESQDAALAGKVALWLGHIRYEKELDEVIRQSPSGDINPRSFLEIFLEPKSAYTGYCEGTLKWEEAANSLKDEINPIKKFILANLKIVALRENLQREYAAFVQRMDLEDTDAKIDITQNSYEVLKQELIEMAQALNILEIFEQSSPIEPSPEQDFVNGIMSEVQKFEFFQTIKQNLNGSCGDRNAPVIENIFINNKFIEIAGYLSRLVEAEYGIAKNYSQVSKDKKSVAMNLAALKMQSHVEGYLALVNSIGQENGNWNTETLQRHIKRTYLRELPRAFYKVEEAEQKYYLRWLKNISEKTELRSAYNAMIQYLELNAEAPEENDNENASVVLQREMEMRAKDLDLTLPNW